MPVEKNPSKDLSEILNEYLERPEHGSFVLKDGQILTTSLASENDAEDVTNLIHRAFAIWKVYGLDLGPMHQTVEQTRCHLVGKGLVIKDQFDKAVGTVSFDFAIIETTTENHLFQVDGQPLIPYRKLNDLELKNNRFLVVKRIATIPDSGRSGLGKSILRFAENLARTLKMDGVVLETVKEVRWLYEWYKTESYQTIGIYQYPGRPLETLLMHKSN